MNRRRLHTVTLHATLLTGAAEMMASGMKSSPDSIEPSSTLLDEQMWSGRPRDIIRSQ